MSKEQIIECMKYPKCGFGKDYLKESNCPVFDMHLTELYPFVSWEDKEPTLIQDILDRYEVIENEKI